MRVWGGWFRLAAPFGGIVLIEAWDVTQRYLGVVWPLVVVICGLGIADWFLARKGR
jgi:hypothetical protein